MKIVFKKPHHSFSYFPGDEADLDTELSEKLIDQGFATEVKKTSGNGPETATIKGKETADIKPEDKK